jgi:serine/threonine protein kinase/Tfp pilus assembly protein PilF
MSSDRWVQIKKVVADALELPEAERLAFVATACAGDHELLEEVSSLVSFATQAADLFESPAFIKNTALTAGARLGPYDIVGLIGAGAMGEVYRAEDARLGRSVAIKVLPPLLSIDHERVRRFEHEARAAGVLNHPNILTVFDIGSYEGTPYVVTELLEGETLRERLDSPITPEVAVGFARQIAEGLSAAHEKGIVHRDLKPENLFVTRDGRVKILDFGIAKLADGLPGEGTSPGTVLGTAGYMSPEQVRAAHTDHRSDLFALGAILYEMLSGRRAFAGPSAAETMSAIVRAQPAKLSSAAPNISARLEQIVERALEKEPEQRFQSARDFARELSAASLGAHRRSHWRVAAAVATIGIVSVVGYALVTRSRGPAVVTRDSVVLGDIENHTGDAVFDGALKQAIVIELDQSPFVQVVQDARVREVLRLMTRSPDERLSPQLTREVCQREGAAAMLIGSIAALGSSYLIELNASDCVSGEVFAREQEQSDRKEEVLGAVSSAVSRLRSRLGESLSSVQRYGNPPERVTTPSLDALKSFSQGVAARARGADGQAIAFFTRSLELDPEFPLANIRLSSIYSVAGEFELAARHAQRAYDRRDIVGERERFTIVYGYYKRTTGELAKAIETLELWRQTYPRDNDPSFNLSSIHAQTGEFDTAVRESLEAIRLNAPAAQANASLARAQMSLGRFDDVRKVIDTTTPSTLSVAQRSFAHWLAFLNGDPAGMTRQLEATRGTLGEPFVRIWHAHAAAAAGRFHEARVEFRDTIAAAQKFGLREVAATAAGLHAIIEAAAGNQAEAQGIATLSVERFFGRQASGLAAIALAMAGGTDAAAALDARLAKAYPLDTLTNNVLLSSTRALIALQRNNPDESLDALRAAAPYEFGWTSYYLPIYIRGLAYLQLHDGRRAQAEFQKILDHPGIIPVSPLHPLSHLQIGRAAALLEDWPAARKSYQTFFSAWKDADAGIPVMAQARGEFERLK